MYIKQMNGNIEKNKIYKIGRINILKKQKKLKWLLIIIPIFLLCLVFVIFTKIYPIWVENKVINDQKENKKKTIKIFKE